MDEYHFGKDILDTFQSSSDYIKTVMLLTPPAFVLELRAVFVNRMGFLFF